MLGIKPYIAFKGNCREAIEFYRDKLGGEILFTQTYGESPLAGKGPDDKIMHCSLKIGDSVIMACDTLVDGGGFRADTRNRSFDVLRRVELSGENVSSGTGLVIASHCEHGGGYLLGLRGLAVIAHGNSSPTAIANAIRLAARGVEHDVVNRLAERLPERVLASARSDSPGK